MLYTCTYQFELGTLYLTANSQALLSVQFHSEYEQQAIHAKNDILDEALIQLAEFFNGKRQQFTLPLKLTGTPFQIAVWQALQQIPYGTTCSYKDIALKINHPKAYRAVGMANNRNKLAIIIPCHRVIGNNKQLVGYAGGLNIKSYLLRLEHNYIKKEFL